MEDKKMTFKDFLCSFAGKICMVLVLYLVIFGLIFALFNIFQNATAPILIMGLGLIVCGWKFLNGITPAMFIILPVGSYIVYLIVKIFLSFICGVFVAPFVIANWISNAVRESLEGGK